MIKDKDGKILTREEDVMKRWEQYFKELLNRPDPVNLINEETYYGPELELKPPTRVETNKAIKSLKNNKILGNDNIPAELWKYGGEVIQEKLHDLMVTIWNEEITPDQLTTYAESIIGEYQCGFRAGRSTIDQIFSLRQVIEKYWEYNKQQTNLFIDFKQVYDSIHRTSTWNIMRKFGILKTHKGNESLL
ncbi:uncharacterized protein [Palaemon carinicauda]|uniref:uncharacterized protein n=1 Tax=Palaemon carinicauda TaxID=392227 RepID=UPI0035B5DE19